MSRRIKPDRRTIADRGTAIEVVRVEEYPGVPKELIEKLIRTRDFLFRVSMRLNDTDYRDDFSRYCMAMDCYFEGDSLDWALKEARLVVNDELYYFW